MSSITISSLTLAAGDTLQLNGVAVTVGQTISAASIPSLVFTPAANSNGSARSSFAFRVNDSDPGVVAATMLLNVTAVNDVPVALTSSMTTNEDTSGSFTVSNFLFSDIEANALSSITISSLTLAAGDTLQLNGVAITVGQTISAASIPSLVFTPAANSNGSARSSFAFRVNDSDPGVVAATMLLNVTAVNDVPVALTSSMTTNEDTSGSFTVSNFLFSDIEANALSSITISSLTLAAGDTLQLNGVAVTVGQTISAASIPSLVFTPAADTNGLGRSSFAFRVNDSDSGIVAATIFLNVTAVNDVPVALTSSVTTNEDTSRSFSVSNFRFTDVEANALTSITISSLTLATGDTLQLNGVAVTVGQTISAASIPSLEFTPAANSNGSARSSFAYRVNDSGTGIVSATMFLNVAAVNDVPVAVASSVTTNEDTPRSFTISNFLFADIDANALSSITISGLTLAAGDTLQFNGVAVTVGQTISAASIPNLVYTPAADSNGSDRSSFAFRVNDSDHGIVAATMSLNVTAVNDVPVALAGSVTTNEDTPRSFSLSNFRFTDLEANALTSITIRSLTLAAGDTLRLNGVAVTVGQTIPAASFPNLVYTPAANSNGLARSRFTFTVNDGGPGVVAATMSLNVTAVNDLPVALASSVTTKEDTPRSFSVSNFLFTDTEKNALASITITSLKLAAGDTLRLNGVAVKVGQTISAASIPKLVYTPAANSNGVGRSRFTFKVNDGGPGVVAATMSLNVTAVNDVPVAVASSVTTNRNTPKFFTVSSFRFTDIEKNALTSITISSLTLAAGDTLRLNGVAVKVGQTILAASIPKLVYTPAANVSGAARSRFTFKVNDAGRGVVVATMSLTVAGK